MRPDKKNLQQQLEKENKRFNSWAGKLADEVTTHEEYAELREELTARRNELSAQIEEIDKELQ